MHSTIGDDRIAFPWEHPGGSRNLSVVLVGFAHAFAPLMILILLQPQPRKNAFEWNMCSCRDHRNIADNAVADIRFDPETV